MRTLDFDLGEGKSVRAYKIDLQPAPLILICARSGWAACGWIDLAAAERFRVPLVQATGVKTIEELLEARVVNMTSFCRVHKIRKGMKVKTALEKLS